MKLITSAGALIALGPEHRYTTRLYTEPDAIDARGVVRGPVYLRGGGDPVLSTTAFARARFNGLGANLDDLARGMKDAGVVRVNGPIVADGSAFDAKRLGPRWRSYYTLYSSPLSGLTTNQNYSGDAPGSYASEPELSSGRRLKAAMRGVGVRQTGGVERGRTPATATQLLAEVSSPPLRAILPFMNKPSDNQLAETIRKGVGMADGVSASTAAGTAKTVEVLSAQGILGAGDEIYDGSGLSRANRVTATTMVRLIAAADADTTWGPALLRSLPSGGEGTLASRLGGVGARVQAKTGTLNGVTALAGRVVSKRGQRYAFAVLVNHSDTYGGRALQDRVVSLLAAGVEDVRGGAPAARGR